MARPYQWGPNLLMYNTRVFPTPPDSWRVVFVKQDLPDGKTNQGRVQAYDGPSISPTPRCLSKPPSRSWGSKTPIN